jgi:hypothetical protein
MFCLGRFGLIFVVGLVGRLNLIVNRFGGYTVGWECWRVISDVGIGCLGNYLIIGGFVMVDGKTDDDRHAGKVDVVGRNLGVDYQIAEAFGMVVFLFADILFVANYLLYIDSADTVDDLDMVLYFVEVFAYYSLQEEMAKVYMAYYFYLLRLIDH